MGCSAASSRLPGWVCVTALMLAGKLEQLGIRGVPQENLLAILPR